MYVLRCIEKIVKFLHVINSTVQSAPVSYFHNGQIWIPVQGANLTLNFHQLQGGPVITCLRSLIDSFSLKKTKLSWTSRLWDEKERDAKGEIRLTGVSESNTSLLQLQSSVSFLSSGHFSSTESSPGHFIASKWISSLLITPYRLRLFWFRVNDFVLSTSVLNFLHFFYFLYRLHKFYNTQMQVSTKYLWPLNFTPPLPPINDLYETLFLTNWIVTPIHDNKGDLCDKIIVFNERKT